MAISRSKKEENIEDLVSSFDEAKLSVLTNYQGLSAEQVNGLRKKLRKKNVSYKVIKNTLVKIALEKSKLKSIDTKVFDGPIAIAFGDDEVEAAKQLVDFSKENESLQIIAAITDESEVLDATNVKSLASLPSREELIAKVVGTMATPISGFVNVMQGNIRNLVYALEAIKQTKN